MEQVISKKAFENLLNAVGSSVINLGDDEKKVFAYLQEICHNAQGDNLLLANLSDCEEYILWKGIDDVRFLVESGCFEEEVQSFSEEQRENLFNLFQQEVPHF